MKAGIATEHARAQGLEHGAHPRPDDSGGPDHPHRPEEGGPEGGELRARPASLAGGHVELPEATDQGEDHPEGGLHDGVTADQGEARAGDARVPQGVDVDVVEAARGGEHELATPARCHEACHVRARDALEARDDEDVSAFQLRRVAQLRDVEPRAGREAGTPRLCGGVGALLRAVVKGEVALVLGLAPSEHGEGAESRVVGVAHGRGLSALGLRWGTQRDVDLLDAELGRTCDIQCEGPPALEYPCERGEIERHLELDGVRRVCPDRHDDAATGPFRGDPAPRLEGAACAGAVLSRVHEDAARDETPRRGDPRRVRMTPADDLRREVAFGDEDVVVLSSDEAPRRGAVEAAREVHDARVPVDM